MGVLLLVCLSCVLGWLSWHLLCHLLIRHRLKNIPAARSLPLLGHALITNTDPEAFVDQVMGMAELFPSPRMVLFWMGPRPALMIYSASLMERILTNSKHLNKGFAYDLLHPWLGLSLLTSESNEWRPRRKLLTPTFHYEILKDFIPIFNDHAKVLVRKWMEKNEGERVEVLGDLSLCALDAICETSMGRSVNAQLDIESPYVRAVHDINQIVQRRTNNPLMWNNFIFQRYGEGKRHDECMTILHGFTKRVMLERADELEKSGWQMGGRQAFLDLLLRLWHEGEIEWEKIQPEVDTFMFEGHDTTSTGITWALHLIGNDTKVQAKLQEEVDSVWIDGQDIGVDELAKLKYLECCIKESLRLFPSVPIILRELGSDQELDGHMIPAGTHILLNLYLTHRDPSQWKDPDVFNPDRFMDTTNRHPFSFVPFSAGSRNCIGQRFALMEEKVILAHIIRHFTMRSIEKRWEVRSKIELIMRPVGGIHVILEKRRDNIEVV